MRILISNDDGYRAAGLHRLAETLSCTADITVVAPRVDSSASSSSLTVSRNLTLFSISDNLFAVDGTASDCVHTAISGIFEDGYFDLVVSGINHGPNLGDDIIYSGTVGAAIEGRFLRHTPIAFSVTSKTPHFMEDAGLIAEMIVQKLLCYPKMERVVYNVNIPDLPRREIQGVRVTRMGKRHQSFRCIKLRDDRSENLMFSLGCVGGPEDCGLGTDFDAVDSGYVSLTPISLDFSHYRLIEEMRGDFL